MANKNDDFSEHDLGLAKPIPPRGKFDIPSDEELDDMTSAEAMEKLASEAAEDWEENAPQNYKSLLKSKKQK